MRSWRPARWLTALAGSVAAALVIGVPTDVVPTPIYTRMTPVQWWNYPVWAATAVLGGLILATYVRNPGGGTATVGRRAAGGGVLSAFAVGCPVCNKLVVLALGASGAMRLFAPLQPALGLLSVTMLAHALRSRLRAERACPVPAGRPA
jgi:hypothetical protein